VPASKQPPPIGGLGPIPPPPSLVPLLFLSINQ